MTDPDAPTPVDAAPAEPTPAPARATILPIRALVTWILLTVLTIANPLLGWELGHGEVISVIVLTIAAVKVRLVGLDFMELRHAPKAFRIAMETYAALLWVILSGCLLLL